MIDYAALESTIGQNWYELDPDLQARVRRDAPAEDFDWADKTLRDFLRANPPISHAPYERWQFTPAEADGIVARWRASLLR